MSEVGRRWTAAEIPSGISLMMISAANKSATVPRKAPRKKPTGVFTRDRRRLLPTAPAMTLVAPPTTTVMKAGATNCWPMKGMMDVVGASNAPDSPASAAPSVKVIR